MCFYNKNIIAFAGRLNSGKTELANVTEEFGYTRLYFALPLKQLTCQLMNVSIDELNVLKRNNTEVNFKFTENVCETISKETQIPINVIEEKCLGTTLKCVRDVLQFIGTDIIRQYNTNWHVNRVVSMMENGRKYVFDDVRFPNEKKAINELGGCVWFVIRPDVKNISHHESEEKLKWQDFGNKTILNNMGLEYFKLRWKLFMHDYEKNIEFRDAIISRIKLTGKSNLGSDLIMIPNELFSYKPIDFTNIESFCETDNGIIVNGEIIDNLYNIEDLKWHLKAT